MPPSLGDKEEKGDSNEQKEKGKQKIILEEDSFSDEDDSMIEKEESPQNETSNKLVGSTYDPPLPFPTALIPKLKPKTSLCNPKKRARTITLSAKVSDSFLTHFQESKRIPVAHLFHVTLETLLSEKHC